MNQDGRKVRILIVDDQALFADSLRAVIGYRTTDFEVVGVAEDGAAAIELARREAPDAILMDIRMPGLDGVQATKAIHSEFPEVKIIVLTSFDDDEYIHDALENGAVAYILKDIPVDELFPSLRAVIDGAFLVSPAVGKETRAPRPRPTRGVEPRLRGGRRAARRARQARTRDTLPARPRLRQRAYRRRAVHQRADGEELRVRNLHEARGAQPRRSGGDSEAMAPDPSPPRWRLVPKIVPRYYKQARKPA